MHRLTFGARLRILRKRSYTTRKMFLLDAERNGIFITARRYGAFERDEQRPTIDEVYKICRLLRVSADEWVLGIKPKVLDQLGTLSDEEIEFLNHLIVGLKQLRF